MNHKAQTFSQLYRLYRLNINKIQLYHDKNVEQEKRTKDRYIMICFHNLAVYFPVNFPSLSFLRSSYRK